MSYSLDSLGDLSQYLMAYNIKIQRAGAESPVIVSAFFRR
jgi:hypothetical protein